MGLKAVLQTLEGLDENLHSYYRKEGDSYVLDLGEDELKAHPGTGGLTRALEREREERKAAKKLADEIAAKYGDLDPEAAREALKAADEAKDRELLDEGKVEELIEQRTERMRADFDKQLAAKDKALDDANTRNASTTEELESIKIFDAVKDAALTRGARKEALTDIQNRARGTWALDDQGRPVARNGEDTIFGKSGEPLTIGEWVDSLSSEASYLFNPNEGGGAGSENESGGEGMGGGVKRIAKDSAGSFLEQIASGEAVIDHG